MSAVVLASVGVLAVAGAMLYEARRNERFTRQVALTEAGVKGKQMNSGGHVTRIGAQRTPMGWNSSRMWDFRSQQRLGAEKEVSYFRHGVEVYPPYKEQPYLKWN